MPIVFDPVMIATSGAVLADAATVAAFERLMRLATLVTPNLPELKALTGLSAKSESEGEHAAEVLAEQIGCAVLAKGGHRDPRDSTQILYPDGSVGTGEIGDVLITPNQLASYWYAKKLDSRHTHGTGCTLASGIATGLAKGMSLPDAIGRAHAFVQAALAHAPGLGQGHGPMGHTLGRSPYEALCRA